jgi:hypothetical protein
MLDLIIMFLLLTLLAVPSFYLFTNYEGRNRQNSGLLHSVSLGNMGFSQTICHDITLMVGKLTLACPTGKIQDVVSFGVTPKDAMVLDSCLPNNESLSCYDMYED